MNQTKRLDSLFNNSNQRVLTPAKIEVQPDRAPNQSQNLAPGDFEEDDLLHEAALVKEKAIEQDGIHKSFDSIYSNNESNKKTKIDEAKKELKKKLSKAE